MPDELNEDELEKMFFFRNEPSKGDDDEKDVGDGRGGFNNCEVIDEELRIMGRESKPSFNNSWIVVIK